MLSADSTYLLAIGVLLAIAAAIIATPVVGARRERISVLQYLIYLFGRTMARWLWRAEVVGALPVGAQCGAIIVCNHRSPFDPAFIQLAAGRVVHWMVAREYCMHPLFARLFRSVQAIPVGRAGIDTAATKLAIRYAQRGELVGMFPEGRLNVSDHLLLSGRPGAALVALKARAPVIPCYISDSPMGATVYTSLFLPAKTRLVIGPLLDLSEYYGREKERDVLEALTKRLLHEIAQLAGHPEFEPSVAGRRGRPED